MSQVFHFNHVAGIASIDFGRWRSTGHAFNRKKASSYFLDCGCDVP